jgi:hypothetical protein
LLEVRFGVNEDDREAVVEVLVERGHREIGGALGGHAEAAQSFRLAKPDDDRLRRPVGRVAPGQRHPVIAYRDGDVGGRQGAGARLLAADLAVIEDKVNRGRRRDDRHECRDERTH